MRINAFKPKSKMCNTCQSIYFQPHNSRGKIWASRKYCTKKCQPVWNKGIKGLWLNNKFNELNSIQKKENHPRWVKDRNTLKKSEKKWMNSAYVIWSRSVKNRDEWVCRIADVNCDGRLEAHHILDWVNYPELRYELNNGITLCHAHHPRGRENEAKLSPYLQSLVAEIK